MNRSEIVIEFGGHTDDVGDAELNKTLSEERAAAVRQYLIDKGIAPERLLFTDDRPNNIATAARRGWQVHLFEGPKGWADRLVAAGLLTPGEAA